MRFLGTIDADVLLSTAGGANPATARRALKSTSAVYTMLVAYTFFGDCSHELADTGVPSERAKPVVSLIVEACRRLARAAALFQVAMTRKQPGPLVAAGSAALAVEPLVARARERLMALRRS